MNWTLDLIAAYITVGGFALYLLRQLFKLRKTVYDTWMIVKIILKAAWRIRIEGRPLVKKYRRALMVLSKSNFFPGPVQAAFKELTGVLWALEVMIDSDTLPEVEGIETEDFKITVTESRGEKPKSTPPTANPASGRDPGEKSTPQNPVG